LEGERFGVFVELLFNEMIAAETAFARFAVDERVIESVYVAGGFPGFGVEEDGAVETNHVASLLDEHRPPEVFDIFFELGAVRAEGIGIGKSAVNFRTWIDKSASFAERNDVL
jgi:hypothetical protein